MAAIGAIVFGLGATSVAHADGPPKADLHVWAGNEVAGSSAVDLRSVEVGVRATKMDRIGLRCDNSLSLDNPTLARQGIDAEAYVVSWLNDFDGRVLLSGEVGTRERPGGGEQKIYKGEAVTFLSGSAVKLGAQVSPTQSNAGAFTNTVSRTQYNFAVLNACSPRAPKAAPLGDAPAVAVLDTTCDDFVERSA